MSVLRVRINSPEKFIWEGEASSVSSENTQGPFDILPEHANFITVIVNKPIRIRTNDKKPLEYTFSQAVIYTHDDKVSIYATL